MAASAPWRDGGAVPLDDHVDPHHGTHSSSLPSTYTVRRNLETTLGVLIKTTCYIGNIPEALTDEHLTFLLNSVGLLRKWKRAQDSSGDVKTFGFAEWCDADSLQSCLRFFTELPLFGKTLTVKIDQQTMDFLHKYQDKIREKKINGEEMGRTKDNEINKAHYLMDKFGEKRMVSAIKHIQQVLYQIERMSEEELAYDFRDQTRFPKPSSSSSNQPSHQERDTRHHHHQYVEDQRHSSSEWESPIFKERLGRWESRESFYSKQRSQEDSKLIDDKREFQSQFDHLQSFDDGKWTLFCLNSLDSHLPSLSSSLSSSLTKREKGEKSELTAEEASFMPYFYKNRDHWREKREREKKRESEYYQKELERERSLMQQEESYLREDKAEEVGRINSIKSIELERRQRSLTVNLGDDLDSSDFSSPERSRRQRLINLFIDSKTGNRKPLLITSLDLKYEDLKAAGYTESQIEFKLKQIKKEKVEKLIYMIPSDRSSIYKWALDSVPINTAEWIRKKFPDLKISPSKLDPEILIRMICKRRRGPEELERLLIEDWKIPSKDAEVWVMKLWRYMIYESESVAYNIN